MSNLFSTPVYMTRKLEASGVCSHSQTTPSLPDLFSLVNDMEDFHLPDHYIRYIEPIESELSAQVEYDMDEQGTHAHETMHPCTHL